MRRLLLILTMITATFMMVAQDNDVVVRDYIKLDVNSMSDSDTERINQYIEDHNVSRSLLAAMGTKALSTLTTSVSSIVVQELMKLTSIRKNRKEKWGKMIKNECRYEESINYLNNLGDFYAKGSFDGPLDPSDLYFDGFTINVKRDNRDVMRFYCHIDLSDEGLDEIFNHSKFLLVLDSMYFYPYNCHLPNLKANQISVKKDKKYDRNTEFSFEDRNNLMVNMRFTLTSSWYNEAVMLAKDVELGHFNVNVPISEKNLVDSVFIYKKGEANMPEIGINGECYLVPRSYTPLPGGVAHWGTGEYNLSVVFSEQCSISPEVSKHWSRDYRRLKRMKNDKEVETYIVNLCRQQGTSVVKTVVETAYKTAFESITGQSVGGGSPRGTK